MQPNYTKAQFDACKSRGVLPLTCKRCHNEFFILKYVIQQILKGNSKSTGDYCGHICKKGSSAVSVECKQCGKPFIKQSSYLKRTKNNFCSKSCAGTYNSQYKEVGTRRSKLERWLEQQLQTKYPGVDFHFNKKTIINSELDIYIPSLKIAFELNGIFHYEPVYGLEKFNQIKNNDKRKIEACVEKGISLCVIDTTSQKQFSPKTGQVFLETIISIINMQV